MGYWLNKIQEHPDTLPSKPSKPPFEGFEGTVNSDSVKNNNIESLIEALNIATNNLSITTTDVYEALSLEDIQSFQSGEINIGTLITFSRSIVQHREMKKGKVPTHFTNIITCQKCGPIWHWVDYDVNDCPWCQNRINKYPIPRP